MSILVSLAFIILNTPMHALRLYTVTKVQLYNQRIRITPTITNLADSFQVIHVFRYVVTFFLVFHGTRSFTYLQECLLDLALRICVVIQFVLLLDLFAS